ncbi:hypothetical protein MP638_002603 [Amoeboaphelidium occidentale]|nr:hypothetical protein MP638_002603 [Amoeboaphelidium occidentale]
MLQGRKLSIYGALKKQSVPQKKTLERQPSYMWRDVYQQALLDQLNKDAKWKGKSALLLAQGMETLWFIYEGNITILQTLNSNGRNRKFCIEFEDIFDLKLVELQSPFSVHAEEHAEFVETELTHFESASDLKACDYGQDYASQKEASLYDSSNVPSYCLCIQYKDILTNGISIMFLSGWNFGAEQFQELHETWTSKRVDSVFIEEEQFQVLWHGMQYDFIKNYHVAWCFTRKKMTLARSDGYSHQIPLFNVSQMNLKKECVSRLSEDRFSETSSMINAELAQVYPLFVSFSRFDASLPFSSINSLDRLSIERQYSMFIDENITIQDFGNSKDFDDLCLLWRQELQLKLIEEYFDSVPSASGKNDSPESNLFKRVLEKHTGDTIPNTLIPLNPTENVNIPSLASSSHTLLEFRELPPQPEATLTRATSMRTLMKRTKFSKKKSKLLETFNEDEEDEDADHEVIKETKSLADLPATVEKDSFAEEILTKLDAAFKTLGKEDEKEQDNNSDDAEIPDSPPKIARRYTNGSPNKTLERAKSAETLSSIKRTRNFSAETDVPRHSIYTAMFEYSAPGLGELAFKQGDLIKIVKKDTSGWWFGLLLLFEKEAEADADFGTWKIVKEGWCPSNFLKSFS